MRKALLTSVLFSLPLFTSACELGFAYGDPNAVIVAASPEVWSEVGDSVFSVLSPDVFTLRQDPTFRLTYHDPHDPDWQVKRMFREEVVIGTPDDFWAAEVLETLDDTVDVTVPGIVQAQDVWARNQYVTLILFDPNYDIPSQVNGLTDDAFEILDRRFRQGVFNRMYVSGVDSALADTLRHTAGFSLMLPMVYEWGAEDSTYIFRNDNPDPAELIRQFAVTWRSPIPLELTTDDLLDWKEELSEDYYSYPQVVEREGLHIDQITRNGMDIKEIRGAWSNPPEASWPAAGPFIVWQVPCPGQDRMYLIDAWIYAPGKDKWEYVLQVENILDSFRCGPGPG
jgi:hypothetical protein